MTDRGSDKHSPRLDDQLKDEVQPIVQGHGAAHVEEALQTEPMPDDTDDTEVVTASGVHGDLVDAPEGVVEHEDGDRPTYTTETGD